MPDVPVFSVYELDFNGLSYSSKDNAVRDVELLTTWQHEKGLQVIQIYGFYDDNGKGGMEGNSFKVRFCPVESGIWTLIQVQSNDKKLNGQHQGLQVNAVPSDFPGFWEKDKESPGNRWYKRSNGDHHFN